MQQGALSARNNLLANKKIFKLECKNCLSHKMYISYNTGIDIFSLKGTYYETMDRR